MMAPLAAQPIPSALERTTWIPLLELSTREVFEIMLGTSLEPIHEPSSKEAEDFTALIGLAGSLRGVLSISCSDAAARTMACKMLGMPADDVSDDSLDALGEIANMIAGNFKAKLTGIGDRCMLSVPTIIVGTDYTTRSLAHGDRIEVTSKFEGKPVSVTLELHD